MTTPKKQSELTEITRGGEWVVMPETPLEITRRVNLHDELVAALEALVNVVDPQVKGKSHIEDLEHFFQTPVRNARDLLRKAKQGDR